MKNKKPQGPLTGLNVIDFGHYYAGPMAAMLLADQGANVIRVVRPGEPELPEHEYELLNRNKKLLQLDLKTEAGRQEALALIAKADVLIENFRPGVMKKLGLDYTSLREANPGLIYLSLPGFASTDEKRASLQAWEGVLGAAVGAYTQISMVRQNLDYPPVYTSVPLCSTYGAVLGGVAIMAALLSREESLSGTVIEVPLFEAGLSATQQSLIGLDAKGWSAAKNEAVQYNPSDDQQTQLDKMSKALKDMVGLMSTTYRCADGRDIYVSTYLTNGFVATFLKAIGLDKQVKREGFVNAGPWESGLDNDVGNTSTLSPKRRTRLRELICDAMMKRPSDEWEEILGKVGVPACVVRSRDEYLALAPMRKSGVVVELDKDEHKFSMPGRLGDVTGANGALIEGYGAAQEVTSAQAEAFFTPRLQAFKAHSSLKKGELLKGLKVLDLCNVIAGPTSAHVLAEYGAEVIKAEAPNGVHPMFIPMSLELNQGKRSILTDVTTAPGRDVFHRMVKWADLVVHNVLDNKARRLGVSHDQLQLIHPGVLSCQLTGYGGTFRGGWETRPSFDNLVQGLSGLLVHYGDREHPLWHGAISSADTIGGYGMAFTSLLSVWQKKRSGVAGEARTSLIRANNHYQLPLMVARDGKSDFGVPKGQFTMGMNAAQRIYRCADDWLYVGASPALETHLAQLVTGASCLDEATLEKAFVQKTVDEWAGLLSEAGIACHPVMTSESLRADADQHVVSNEAADEAGGSMPPVLVWENHPCGTAAMRLAAETGYIGEARTTRRLKPAPRYGENSREILVDLGYSEKEGAELIRLKAVHDFLPGIGTADRYFFTPEG